MNSDFDVIARHEALLIATLHKATGELLVTASQLLDMGDDLLTPVRDVLKGCRSAIRTSVSRDTGFAGFRVWQITCHVWGLCPGPEVEHDCLADVLEMKGSEGDARVSIG